MENACGIYIILYKCYIIPMFKYKHFFDFSKKYFPLKKQKAVKKMTAFF